MIDVDSLTTQEWAELTQAVFLRLECEGGRLPQEAFYTKLRTFPTPFMEIVCVYEGVDGLQVLLHKRDDDDPYWPGQYATQGITVMGRQTLADVARNHTLRESGIPISDREIGEMEFAGCVHLPHLEREHSFSPVFIRRFARKPKEAKGSWHRLNDLPKEMVPHTLKAILPVVQKYLETGRPNWTEYLGYH